MDTRAITLQLAGFVPFVFLYNLWDNLIYHVAVCGIYFAFICISGNATIKRLRRRARVLHSIAHDLNENIKHYHHDGGG